jgi:hypothetical protein
MCITMRIRVLRRGLAWWTAMKLSRRNLLQGDGLQRLIGVFARRTLLCNSPSQLRSETPAWFW